MMYGCNILTVKKMRIALFLIVILVSGVVFCGCMTPTPPVMPAVTPAATPALQTVKVAYSPTTANGPLYIAKEEGYFAEQGVNVELEKYQSPAAALPVLIHGDIAVSTGPLKIGLINALAKGEHVRIVADKGRIIDGYCDPYALMVRKDLYEQGIIRNVSDLKGKKISQRDSDYDLFNVLALGNLSNKDVETMDMDWNMVVPAFRSGAIDAALITDPYMTQALDSGSAVVLVPGKDFLPDWPLPVYYGPAILDKDPELGKRFMVGYLKGVKQYNEGKTERNLAILQNYTKLDRDILNRSCWYPIAADGYLPKKPVHDYMNWMYANKKISQILTDDQIFDMSYVDYANGVLRNTTNTGETK